MVKNRRRLLLAMLAACVLVAVPSPLSGTASARSSEYTLRVFVNGNGTVKGSGVDCGAKGSVCGVSYALGTTTTVDALPEQFLVFAGWTGACTGAGPVCTLTAGTPTTVTATFNYIEVVDVNKTGSGQGTVISSPGGINCGPTCSAPFTGNTRVTLVANALPGSVFAGWNGYCKGKGACVLQQTYGTMAVTAEFVPKGQKAGYTLPSTTGGSSSVRPFVATSQGASVRKTRTGRLISVRFTVSKTASVRLQIWHWKKLISQAKLSVKPGPVTVKLPFSAGYKAGEYDLWAYLTGTGEKKPKLLHWKVQVR
jgi:Divergent InlB B-repeat domain